MKNINKALTSVMGRTFIYLSIFIVGSALYELLFQLIRPATGSDSGIALTLSTIAVFTLIGLLFACEQHVMSRVSSAATLLVLGFMAVRIGHSFVPDSYSLVATLCIAAVGAQPGLHRKLTSLKRIVLYSILAIVISVALVAMFTYGTVVLERIYMQQQFSLHS